MGKITHAILRLSEPHKWVLFLTTAFLARTVFLFTFVDLHNTHYWEYGEISRNLFEGRGYSLFYLWQNKIDIYYLPQATPYPSAYVPPGYVWFLTPFWSISSDVMRSMVILTVQNMVSLAVIVSLYRFTYQFTTNTTIAWFAALLYAFIPEFIFTSNSFGPTVFYHAVVVGLLLQLHKPLTSKRILHIAVLFACGLYLRSEMVVFMILWALAHGVMQKKVKQTARVVLLALLLFSPWTIRNYLVFKKLIPLSTSSGINLYRGHNEDGTGSWGWSKHVYPHTAYLCGDDNFEIRFSSLYADLAKAYIMENKLSSIKQSFKNLYDLWWLPDTDARARSVLYIGPWLLLLLCSIPVLWIRKKDMAIRYVLLYLLSCSLVAMLFFVLPRYQTLMKISLLPFAAIGLHYALYVIKHTLKKHVT
jgi:hypothetical protein